MPFVYVLNLVKYVYILHGLSDYFCYVKQKKLLTIKQLFEILPCSVQQLNSLFYQLFIESVLCFSFISLYFVT